MSLLTQRHRAVWHEASIRLFNESRAVLASGLFTSAIKDFREIEDDYGFLPYPKWDEA